MRIGEVCALKWCDIDFGTETIHVNRTIERIYIIEGDERHTELVIGTPKTKNSMREIPISKELIKLIRPLKKLMNDDYFLQATTETTRHSGFKVSRTSPLICHKMH